MTVSQLSVFAENTPGVLHAITEQIAKAGVSIRAISIADTQDFGILRMVVSDAKKAETALKANNFVVSVTQILGIEVPDTPGGLSDVLKYLSDSEINVNYVYASVTIAGKRASVAMHVSDNEKAQEVLNKNGVHILSEDDMKNI